MLKAELTFRSIQLLEMVKIR